MEANNEVKNVDTLETSPTLEDGGKKKQRRMYWFFRHLKENTNNALRRHIFLCIFLLIILSVLIFLFRAGVQPYVLFLRTKIFVLFFGFPPAYLIWRMIFFGTWWRRVLAIAFATPILFSVWEWGDEVHEYISLYIRYKTLTTVELGEMPTTDHERIQPLYSVHSNAYEATAHSDLKPMTPNFVRNGDGFDWTIGVEPDHFVPRLIGGVKKVFHASGTTANVNFLDQSYQSDVSFWTGENSFLGYNVFTATIKTFGLRRYCNYETDRVTYLFDDRGELVQVVSLIRWKGLLFPRREFGGVQIIHQIERDLPVLEHITRVVSLLFLGSGEWIPPQEIKRYHFLQGQNIVPFAVTRYMANSFRFKEGVTGPLPWVHKGDVRIPDMEQDINPQPFTTFFRIPGFSGELVHYFGLEPFGMEKQATILSLLIPSDDASAVYVYSHEKHNDLINGVSTIPAKVMGSQKMYTWDKNWPVEQRPYVKDIEGRRRFYWLTTLVTKKEVKEGELKQLIAGVRPEIALTDGKNNEPPIWVNPLAPETWIEALKKHL